MELAQARKARITPLLLFVGQIAHGDAGRDAFQEIDDRRMFGPVANRGRSSIPFLWMNPK